MIDRRLTGSLIAATLLAALAVLAWRAASVPDQPARTGSTLGEAIGRETEGYRRAEPGTPIRFPEDHGAHPDYQLEWWYLTANLRAEDGRRFGVQFTIFRNALAPPDSGSAAGDDAGWGTRQLYLAHAAVTDVAADRFMSAERLSRGGAGLAFARAEPLEIRVENWYMRQTGDSTFPLRVVADAGDGAAVSDDAGTFAFNLEVVPLKPVVLQGDGGYSPKGPAEGQASLYYSYTRLAASGSIRIGGRQFHVEGLAWMDREWSTSFLGTDQVGWDWFSVQLDDGRDLMVFRLRTSDPEKHPWTEGTLVAPDGSSRRIDPADISIEPGRVWTSPRSGGRYPVEWRIRIPSEGLDLRVNAVRDAQELNVSVDYWEGAVDVARAAGGERTGSGYLEMTGYADERALPGVDP